MQNRKIPRWLKGVFFGLVVTGIGMGVGGFLCDPSGVERSTSQRIFDAVHSTIQLVFVNVSARESQGFFLGFARLVLPLATSLYVISVLWRGGARWLVFSWMRVWPRALRKPIILLVGCGRGRDSLRIAQYYASRGAHVIGIDEDSDSDECLRFQEAGFWILEMNVLEPNARAVVPWYRADRVVLCISDDSGAVDIARSLLERMESRVRRGPWRLTVMTDSPLMPRLSQFDAALIRGQLDDRLSFLDVRHYCARLLFLQCAPHLLSVDPERFRADRENPCHIALMVSRDQVGAYVKQAARSLVYCTKNPLRITVLTSPAADVASHLRASVPALFVGASGAQADRLGAVADVTFEESSPEQVASGALEAAHRRQALDVLYVIGKNDDETAVMLSEAIKSAAVLSEPRPAVVAAFHTDQVVIDSDLSQGATGLLFKDVKLTGVMVRTFCLDAWLDGWKGKGTIENAPESFNDKTARLVKETYNIRYGGAPWEQCPDDERWMNRYTADHEQIKLALLRRAAPERDVVEAIAGFKMYLSELEHRRYVCERRIDGWLPIPGRQKIVRYLLNPTLIPFDELKREEQEKDLTITELMARPEQQAASAPESPKR